ncbi:hypothetical protein [Paenibacillus polymyxa]|uniref:hypothetical protein n=1 Tax=Paenibacillus polymyxa TaxID=1406 RepID=UPI00129BF199|nr:hypothetical protein [Paenibacillus polymyxa]KAE8560229.1 hypothetical protein BJH92_10130 [Paenibacillus polymyxa]MCJ1223324.1 hypothetical protein [Paenibacillus polymyxa]
MNELQIAETKGLVDVRVYQICECDAVAAYSLEEAKEWYKSLTGLEDSDLYPDEEVEIVSMNLQVYEDEDKVGMITVREIVNNRWQGEPLLAFTSGM